ncbi:gem-associated protein 2 isoform X1 [Phacochoerus africanus]|uniref:gem-associated protein 2 isoform X1 n=1 Tax=Phacochoerus africanus TaxID=41426 RepID=UPI001FDA7DDB|nr:gem-associated protein 2 isoform X1 [Phacochoerus africanus]
MRRAGRAGLKTMAWVPAEAAVEELMPQLLPVEPCDLTEGFDPSVPPRTPQEYLRRVQIEAAQCPDVVVAQIDPKKLKRKQSVNVSLSGCQPAPEGYSPTLQWQQQQVAQFSTVRQSVNRHRSHWKSQQLDSNVTMPKSEDEEGWKKFCLGERLCAEGVTVGPAASESPGIDYVQIGFPPLLSIVSRMNQATVTSVLEYLSNWFGERDFTPELGRWLYALLACLEKPLLPEAHSLIRQLARRCSEVRLLVDSKDDERVPALNLLICLVSRSSSSPAWTPAIMDLLQYKNIPSPAQVLGYLSEMQMDHVIPSLKTLH